MGRYDELRFSTHDEWVEARAKGIGGSDVAAIMGISAYKSPLEVWLEKTGKVPPADLSDNEKVEWGTRLEQVIANKFAEEHPNLKVLRKNCTMRSVDRPWALANIDRELRGEGRGILEVKTAGLRSEDQWVFGPPAYYLTQVQHYLSVTGWDYAYVAVLIGGQEYREYRIERDEEDIAAIDKAVDEFWNEYVMKGVMPKMTGKGRESQALTAFYPEGEGVEYVSDMDMPILAERVELGRQIKALEERKKLIDNEIRARIGLGKCLESESVRATWVRTASKKFDAKAFDADHPGLRDKYMTDYVKDMGIRLSAAKG